MIKHFPMSGNLTYSKQQKTRCWRGIFTGPLLLLWVNHLWCQSAIDKIIGQKVAIILPNQEPMLVKGTFLVLRHSIISKMSNLKFTVCSKTSVYLCSFIRFVLGTTNNFICSSTSVKVDDDFYLLHVNTMKSLNVFSNRY